jgi:hypothetical protein
MSPTHTTRTIATLGGFLLLGTAAHADSMYGMTGMSGIPPGTGAYWMSAQQYVTNPYDGMYGSMGGVYGPYYRQFYAPAMSGMAGMYPGSGPYWMSGQQYILNPQYGMSGMYGSMGNVYAPYSRQFYSPGIAPMPYMGPGPGMYGVYGMSGMSGMQ